VLCSAKKVRYVNSILGLAYIASIRQKENTKLDLCISHFSFPYFLFELRRRKAVPVIDQKVTNERTGPLQVLMNDDGYYTPKFIFSLTHSLSFFLVASLLRSGCSENRTE